MDEVANINSSVEVHLTLSNLSSYLSALFIRRNFFISILSFSFVSRVPYRGTMLEEVSQGNTTVHPAHDARRDTMKPRGNRLHSTEKFLHKMTPT